MKLDDMYIDKVTAAIMKNRTKGMILVHCSSVNRVGVWIGGHFYKDHNFSIEDAKIVANKLGLKDREAQLKLQNYFNDFK